MSAEDRMLRALAAPVAPAKDMHFMLEVMRRAEAQRYRAGVRGRLRMAAALCVALAGALYLAAGWASQNPETLSDALIAVGGLMVVTTAIGAVRRLAR